MEPQRPIEATGLIKHISKLKKVPTGKLRVLDPMACRGLEVTFSLDDVKIPHDERRLLEAGVMLQFRIKGDSWNGFVAYQISPVDCAQYTGYVIRVPTPSNPRDGTVVSLDLTLDPVIIRKKSLEKLKLREPLACRDYVRVAIHWSDWISAQRANRKPEFDIVEVLERSKTRPRSLSQGREGSSVDQSSRIVRVREHLPSEELSPQYERSTRKQRRMSQGASRPRSRSVGPVVPSANDFVPLQSYPYMPAQRFPGQYPVFNPDVMYGSYNDFYNASLMWTASNYIPPYMQRGAP